MSRSDQWGNQKSRHTNFGARAARPSIWSSFGNGIIATNVTTTITDAMVGNASRY